MINDQKLLLLVELGGLVLAIKVEDLVEVADKDALAPNSDEAPGLLGRKKSKTYDLSSRLGLNCVDTENFRDILVVRSSSGLYKMPVEKIMGIYEWDGREKGLPSFALDESCPVCSLVEINNCIASLLDVEVLFSSRKSG